MQASAPGSGPIGGTRRALAQRKFTVADQEWFAGFSGDHNPLHMDPTAARRLMFGRPVVHGIHVAMWALDAYVARDPRPIAQLDVSFPRPVFLDEEVELVDVGSSDDEVRLRVEIAGRTLAGLRVHFGRETGDVSSIAAGSEEELPVTPRELHLEQMEGQRGRMPVPAGAARRAGAFDALAGVMSERFVAEVAALSRLVGMECPGLHSIFGGFKVSADVDTRAGQLTWDVSRVNPEFSALRIRVAGRALRGTITAFVRPEPHSQLSSSQMVDHIAPAEFEHIRALVIGGSRGLGELTAKLLAAGGAEVTVTWHRGHEDAESVAADMRSSGGTASTLHLDVTDPFTGLRAMSEQGGLPTHLFYFASPRITARRVRVFDADVFRTFTDAYVEGFANSIEACRAIGVDRMVAFYPSTVAIEWSDPDLIEYAAAKAAGERMALALGASQDWLDVLVERLPALATDQTVTLTTGRTAADPLPVMTAVLRRGSVVPVTQG